MAIKHNAFFMAENNVFCT